MERPKGRHPRWRNGPPSSRVERLSGTGRRGIPLKVTKWTSPNRPREGFSQQTSNWGEASTRCLISSPRLNTKVQTELILSVEYLLHNEWHCSHVWLQEILSTLFNCNSFIQTRLQSSPSDTIRYFIIFKARLH